MLFWLLTICLLIIIYYKIYKPLQYWKEINVPYEKPWPIVGNMGSVLLRQKSIPDWVLDIYNSHKTRYFGIYQFGTPTIMIKDVELIKQICIKDFDSFIDRRTIMQVDENDKLLNNALIFLKGQKWKDMRSTLSPLFTGSKMRAMFELMSECAEQFADHFAKITDPKVPITFDMQDIYNRYGNDVIATCAFGIKCDSVKEENNGFYQMGKEAVSGFRSLKILGFIVIPKIMHLLNINMLSSAVLKYFPDLIKSTIKTREEKGIIRPDLIHLLMEARKGKLKHEKTHDTDAGFATVEESHIGTEVQNNKLELTDDIITSQALIFFLAGFDAASILLCMVSYELAVNYDVQKKLQEEIDTTFAECNGILTYTAVLKMKYLDMIVSETLRLWTPGPILDRLCVKPFTIEPIDSTEQPLHLKKGDMVWIPLYGIHRDPKYYPNPEKFDPERFSDENKQNIQPYTYLPFGIGPRNCIASRFALLEVKTLLVHFLSKCELEVVDKTQVPFKFSKGQFNFASEKGIWLGLKSRK